ncbi:MAG: NAD(+) diphosphatase [Betaproteobacteria bacterium]
MLITPEGFLLRLDYDNAPDSGYWFVVHGGRLLVTRGESPRLPAHDSPPVVSAGAHAVHHFGDYDGRPCRVMVIADIDAFNGIHDEHFEWRGLRSLFGVLPDAEVGLAGRAVQLAEWTRTHRYCGCCGTLMQRQPGERAMACPACGFTAYPRIAPAMMLVRRDDRILLGRAPHFVGGVYSALAGFVEAGESLEECVHREVMEEVGIAITNLRYFSSQSWPFPHSLMLAFIADYASGDLRPNPAELSDAQWFGLDALPQLPSRISISRALIEAGIAEIRQRQ